MKKALYQMLLFIGLAVPVTAQNVMEVSGTYQGQVVWEADTVRVMADVVIEPNGEEAAKLVVAPGTKVFFEGYYRITILNGSLFAQGTESEPILFTSNKIKDFDDPDIASGWRGLHVISNTNSNDTVIMEHCTLRYGKVLNSAPEEEWNGAGLKVINKKYCRLSDCYFADNYAYKGNPYLSPGMGGGAVYVDNPTRCFVERCLFERNYASWGASLLLRGLRYFTVNDCEFRDNSGTYGTAMYMWLGEVGFNAMGPRVYNNYIHANHGNAVYLSWDWAVGRFHDNVISNNEGYAPVIGGTAPNYSLYYNNTIANNQSDGFIGGQGKGIWTCGQQKIFNNIFYGNLGVCFERMDPTHEDPTVFNNNLAHNDGYSGTDPVFGDPLFVQPTSGLGPENDFYPQEDLSDWTLQVNSPCINAGSMAMQNAFPDMDFYGNPRVRYVTIDIGAVEYQGHEDVGENETAGTTQVYPNPGSDILNIKAEASGATLEVYDLTGRKVFGGESNNSTTTIDTKNWPSGIYFWRISDGNAIETGKWIKQ